MSAARLLGSVVLITAGVVVAALLIAQDQETLRIRSPIGAADPGFAEYAGALIGSPVSYGDRVEVLINGDQIFPAMLDAIRQARTRISFETYIYGDGEIPDLFTRELAAAARRGVTVNIVLDAVGTADISAENLGMLQTAGCRIGSFNPTHWYSLEELNYRTHRKILVVDGRVGFTGGVGLADHWSGNAQDAAHWRDTQVRVAGPSVRLLEAAFYENWIESQSEVAPVLDPAPPPEGTSARSVTIWSSPVGGASAMKRLYLVSIAAARETLAITSPYFILDESTRWVLEQARRRGVRVRVLVEGDVTDARPVKYASRADYESLLAQGIEIYEYQPTMMHAKSLVADAAWSVVGTANFDNRSLELNDEVNMGIADRVLARRLIEVFEADLRRARRLGLEEWRRRSLDEKLREKLWSLFGEVF